MRENEYDMERDLEEVSDLLRVEDIDCPNCGSPVSPHLNVCPICEFKVKKPKDESFEDRLKLTIWSPGKERGIPLGKDLPRSTSSQPLFKEEEMTGLDEDASEHNEPTVFDEIQSFSRHTAPEMSQMRARTSLALISMGILFYFLTSLFFHSGDILLVFLVVGTLLILVGGSMVFDTLLQKSEGISGESRMVKERPSLSGRLLGLKKRTASPLWILVVLVGGLSYVMIPAFVADSVPIFLGLSIGSVMVVVGANFAYHTFFTPKAGKEEKENLPHPPIEIDDELEWICPVCANNLREEDDVCPTCGAELED